MSGSGEVTTYAELDERSNRLAHAFRRSGLAPGDHVALMMANGSPFLETAWAARRRQAYYYTALNAHLRRDEAQYILDDCGARALVITAGRGRCGCLARARRHPVPRRRRWRPCPASSTMRTCSPRGRRPRSRTRPRAARCSTPRGPPACPRACASRSASPFPATHGVHGGGDRAGHRRHGGSTGSSVYLSPAPLYHSAPLVYTDGHAPPRRHRPWSWSPSTPPPASRLIGRYRVTPPSSCPPCSPGMLRLPDERAAGATTCRACATSSTPPRPCPVPVKHRMLEWWGPIIYEYYAGTEDLGSSSSPPDEWLAHPGSVEPSRETSCTSSATTARSCPPGAPAPSTSPAVAPSTTTTTRTRRRPSATGTGGAPSATSATSTPTATST